jgi:hypothetical protein
MSRHGHEPSLRGKLSPILIPVAAMESRTFGTAIGS